MGKSRVDSEYDCLSLWLLLRDVSSKFDKVRKIGYIWRFLYIAGISGYCSGSQMQQGCVPCQAIGWVVWLSVSVRVCLSPPRTLVFYGLLVNYKITQKVDYILMKCLWKPGLGAYNNALEGYLFPDFNPDLCIYFSFLLIYEVSNNATLLLFARWQDAEDFSDKYYCTRYSV